MRRIVIVSLIIAFIIPGVFAGLLSQVFQMELENGGKMEAIVMHDRYLVFHVDNGASPSYLEILDLETNRTVFEDIYLGYGFGSFLITPDSRYVVFDINNRVYVYENDPWGYSVRSTFSLEGVRLNSFSNYLFFIPDTKELIVFVSEWVNSSIGYKSWLFVTDINGNIAFKKNVYWVRWAYTDGENVYFIDTDVRTEESRFVVLSLNGYNNYSISLGKLIVPQVLPVNDSCESVQSAGESNTPYFVIYGVPFNTGLGNYITCIRVDQEGIDVVYNSKYIDWEIRDLVFTNGSFYALARESGVSLGQLRVVRFNWDFSSPGILLSVPVHTMKGYSPSRYDIAVLDGYLVIALGLINWGTREGVGWIGVVDPSSGVLLWDQYLESLNGIVEPKIYGHYVVWNPPSIVGIPDNRFYVYSIDLSNLPSFVEVWAPVTSRVYLDGVFVGETPLRLNVSPGIHTFRIVEELYYPYNITLNVESGRGYLLDADLRPLEGVLSVLSSPEAIVIIDGHGNFTAPFNLTLAPGKYLLKFQSAEYPEQYMTITKIVQVFSNRTTVVSVSLPLVYSNLTIMSSPQGARIILNGSEVGITPMSVLLKPGLYNISLQLEGYKPFSTAIDLRSREFTINATLERLLLNNTAHQELADREHNTSSKETPSGNTICGPAFLVSLLLIMTFLGRRF